jgi:hypothetical protein
MRRCLLALLLVTLLSSRLSPQPVAAEGPITISGNGLPHPVSLAPVDVDTFRRRISPPPKLEDEPNVSGPAYTITANYWDEVIRGDNSRKERVETEATYYSERGFVRARQGGEDVWIVIDLRQRTILDRYIRADARGEIGETPGVLEVLLAAARDGEQIGVQVGDQLLSQAQADQLWQALAGTGRPSLLIPQQPPSPEGQGRWIIFNLVEGRTVQLFAGGSPASLTDSLGWERYSLPADLASLLRADQPESTATIGQEKGTGSPLWWPVMLGGGLACLALALWWQRRFSNAQPR